MMYLKLQDGKNFQIKKHMDGRVLPDGRIFVPAVSVKMTELKKNNPVDIYTTEDNYIIIVPREIKD